MFKQANCGMKNLRTFLNKQIAKSSVISGLKNKPQTETFTHSLSSVDFNEIERQFHTIGKRQSIVIQRSRIEIMADVKRPDRPPPPIPPPYSKHKETRGNQFLTEGETRRLKPLTPPLPQKKLNIKTLRGEDNLISFEGQTESGLFSSLQQQQQQQQPPSLPIPRRLTNPYSYQPSYGSTTTTTNLLLFTPTTDTTLDELLSYATNSKEELN